MGKPPGRKRRRRGSNIWSTTRKRVQREKKSDHARCDQRRRMSTNLQSSVFNKDENISKKSEMETALTDHPSIVDDTKEIAQNPVDHLSNSFMKSNETSFSVCANSCISDNGNSAVPSPCTFTSSCSDHNPVLNNLLTKNSVDDEQADCKTACKELEGSENSETELLPCTVVEVVMVDDLHDERSYYSQSGLLELAKKTEHRQIDPSVSFDDREESCSIAKMDICHEQSLNSSLIQTTQSSLSTHLQVNGNSSSDAMKMKEVYGENIECVLPLSADVGKTCSPVECNIQTEIVETSPKRENLKGAVGFNEDDGNDDVFAKFNNSVTKNTRSYEATTHLLKKRARKIDSSEEPIECTGSELSISETSSRIDGLPSLSAVKKGRLKARSKQSGHSTYFRRITRSSAAYSVSEPAAVVEEGNASAKEKPENYHICRDATSKDVKKLTACLVEKETHATEDEQNQSEFVYWRHVTENSHQKTSSGRDLGLSIFDKQKGQMLQGVSLDDIEKKTFHESRAQCEVEDSHGKLENECDLSNSSKVIIKSVSCRSDLVNKGANTMCDNYEVQNMCLKVEKNQNSEKIKMGGDQKEEDCIVQQVMLDNKRKLETKLQQKEDKITGLLQERIIAVKEMEQLNKALKLERETSTVMKEATDRTLATLDQEILILRLNLKNSEQSLNDCQRKHSRIFADKDKYWKQKLENVIKESDMLRSHLGKLEYGRLLLQKELKLPSRPSSECDFNVEVEAIESLKNELLQEKAHSESIKNALKADREKMAALEKNARSSKEKILQLKIKLEKMKTKDSNKLTENECYLKEEMAKSNKEVDILKEHLSKIEKGKSLLRQELGLQSAQLEIAEFGEEIECISLILKKLKDEKQNLQIIQNDLKVEKNKVQLLEHKLLQAVERREVLCDIGIQTADLKPLEPCNHSRAITQLENALDYQLSLSKTIRGKLASRQQEKRVMIDSLKEEYSDTVDDYEKILSSLMWVSDRSRKRLKKLEDIISQQYQ